MIKYVFHIQFTILEISGMIPVLKVKGQLIHFVTGGVLSGMWEILLTPIDPIYSQRKEDKYHAKR